jgi:glycosyltransferase involved in cell wall biosynthesis
MVLIDATFINNGGGKLLLDLLIKELEKTDTSIIYLIDSRNDISHFEFKLTSKVVQIQPSILQRHIFYRENRSIISKVLCFGNIPPTIKLDCLVYCYFHNFNFLNIPREYPFSIQFINYIKRKFISLFSKNVNFWFVQSKMVKDNLIRVLKIDRKNVLIAPFFPLFSSLENKIIERRKLRFLYVSGGLAHKNHHRLIDAFCSFYDKYHSGELLLTIEESQTRLLSYVNKKQRLGYPIQNNYFNDRELLQIAYKSSEFLIFPSVSESFGLGLIEGIENGCKVIAADLPYTYEVCVPSIVFDPYKTESIFLAMEYALKNPTKPSLLIVQNSLNNLINKILNE